MERLTFRNNLGKATSHINPRENYMDFVNRLAEYEDAEEQGLLIKLPCKVGDTLYEIEAEHNALTYNDGTNIEEIKVDGFNIYENSIFFTADDESYAASGENSCIGKTVFLTREAADEALKGGEGE